MPATRPRRTASPVLESLENRRLLAGNITATLKSGTLTIKGDKNDNVVTVFGGSNAKMIVIKNDQGTVNGKKSFTVKTKSFTHDLKVDMKQGGDDKFVAGGLNILGNTQIYTGSGKNAVSLSEINTSHTILIWTSDNDDFLSLSEVATPSVVGIITGGGNDQVFLHDLSVKNGSISLGDGDDGLTLDGDLEVGDHMDVDGGDGNGDLLEYISVTGDSNVNSTGFEKTLNV